MAGTSQTAWETPLLSCSLGMRPTVCSCVDPWSGKFNKYLLACSDLQKHSPWGMKKVLLEMEDQRSSYEQKAKASLQKVLEEKMCAEQQLQRAQVEMLCSSRGWGPGLNRKDTVS